ncbi:PDR/VanB family oxidoreductase [Kaistia dalseonensis]|uniref:Vanillate O-demethylase ferredoxin subunit n=1 Tax=Kaistia dalseonensis TaxID=410840 RepID=A0ABU0H2S4_9HYPH|nr:PDR/VanB family oxidoreductase [Kaistia dalseonensis]MCX5494032.1 PDR/VanB family oxidoreductase [Kaistia dalseonensis]MDQ0436610.1 vanillate O-demethylase ferredoxin subunit [Kaistia dalseonensis]
MTTAIKDRSDASLASDPLHLPSSVAESGPLQLRVEAIRFEAETIRSIELRAPDGSALPPFTPGAHIDLALPGELSRSYSLINAASDGDRYVVAVNRDAASRGGSAYLCETLRVGEILSVMPPRNSFPLVETASESVFFAGGIGITPILAMIRHLEAIGRPWRLFYAVRDRANAAFLAQLARLEAVQPGRVHLHVDKEAGSVMAVAARIADVPADAHLYCCGPTPMIAAFKDAAAGRSDHYVHVEHFVGTAAKPTGEFKIILKRSQREFTVSAGKTIMDVLMEAGVRVAHSCREGVCGTCETRVIEGVPDHKDNVLSARERASNKLIMICCSGAKTDRLVLDL